LWLNPIHDRSSAFRAAIVTGAELLTIGRTVALYWRYKEKQPRKGTKGTKKSWGRILTAFPFLRFLCLFAAPVSSKDVATKKHKGHKKEVGRILAAVALFALFVPLCGPVYLKGRSLGAG
jgi:hypothetical protein